MTARERIIMIRLMEKIERHPSVGLPVIHATIRKLHEDPSRSPKGGRV